MAVPQKPASPPNNLALCVPALARAGQILCTVVAPAQARDALRQAAAVLESNGRFVGISGVKDLADTCRAAADSTEEAQLVPICRQLAATTARHVTAVAHEIQQQAKGQGRPALPTAATPPETPKPAIEIRPVQAARPAGLAKPAGKPQPAEKPQVSPGRVERITVARTPAEKAAVTLALQNGKRFAVVGNGTLIDTQANQMWAARVGPTAIYGVAQTEIQKLHLANYADWRLPTPDELKRLLADEGSDFARSSGLFTAEKGRGGVDQLWTSESRLRFWFFGREATCLSVHTGGFSRQKAGATGVGVLAVRSP
jgi:hypothetical protein